MAGRLARWHRWLSGRGEGGRATAGRRATPPAPVCALPLTWTRVGLHLRLRRAPLQVHAQEQADLINTALEV